MPVAIIRVAALFRPRMYPARMFASIPCSHTPIQGACVSLGRPAPMHSFSDAGVDNVHRLFGLEPWKKGLSSIQCGIIFKGVGNLILPYCNLIPGSLKSMPENRILVTYSICYLHPNEISETNLTMKGADFCNDSCRNRCPVSVSIV